MEDKLKTSDLKEGTFGWKQSLFFILRLIISCLLIYFIFSLVKWKDAVSAYYTAENRFLLYSFLLLFLNIFLRTLKWKVIICSVKKDAGLRESFGSLMLGISLGSVTPGELGEYAGRAFHISGAKKSHIVGLSLLDKFQIFIITAAFGLISYSLYLIQSAFWVGIISAAMAICSFYVLLRIDLISSLGHKLNSAVFKKPFLTRILEGLTLISRKSMILSFLLTIIFHFVVVLQMFCLVNAFSDISFINAFIATSAMLFTKSLLPFSLSDLGIREASSIFFFSAVGISNVAALNAALMLFIINVFLPGLVGTYFLWNQRHLTSGLFSRIKHHWNS